MGDEGGVTRQKASTTRDENKKNGAPERRRNETRHLNDDDQVPSAKERHRGLTTATELKSTHPGRRLQDLWNQKEEGH